jgi:CRISPR-associated protein Csb2
VPRALLLTVRFHDGRYHGRPEWPPSPARLFQALVAGAADGESLHQDDRDALAWLERLKPPVIAAPAGRTGSGFRNYVPNNDLDAVGGDPRRIGEIRAPKLVRPWLFDPRMPLLYLWSFDQDAEHAATLTWIAGRLYQLGRGVDMAYAIAEVLDNDEGQERLSRHGGAIHRPCRTGEGRALACPMPGSLASLEERFRKMRKRFSVEGKGRTTKLLFTQPPKARFALCPYDSPPLRLLYELRKPTAQAEFAPQATAAAVRLVERVRDEAKSRLENALPDQAALIDRVFVGRNATQADKASRIRIIPLPSTGHAHADLAIRRLLIEVPPDCPLRADDVAWAFGNLAAIDQATGEILWTLVPAEDQRMLVHYGIDGRSGHRGHRLWRSMTPAALPEAAARRRIDPARRYDLAQCKDAKERLGEEDQAAAAVRQALRHAGTVAQASGIRVQREPFAANGLRAEAFAAGTRFAKERLWHVEVGFPDPVAGPLAIGDGRYLGLGVMAPVRESWRDIMIFRLPPAAALAPEHAPLLLRAVRRALMALARDDNGHVPRLFSGHEDDGAPARSGRHGHVFLAADDTGGDGRVDRLIVAAPWACDRSATPQRGDRARFDQVVSTLEEVRAGPLDVLRLALLPAAAAADDPLLGPAQVWESRTSYHPTRHARRRADPAGAVVLDVALECDRRGLPRPQVELLQLAAGPRGGGLSARVRLRFEIAVRGPILLGLDSHHGGGLFYPTATGCSCRCSSAASAAAARSS